jgi:hypothetical protein
VKTPVSVENIVLHSPGRIIMSSHPARGAAVTVSLLLLFGLLPMPAAAASFLTYEIYTLQAGDTRENLALRHGLQTEEVISIDDGPWQPGKRVALLKRYSEQPGSSGKSGPSPADSPLLASVIRAESDIRSEPAGGDFLFRPETGSKVIVVDETPTHYGVVMADQSTGWIEKSALSIEGPVDNEWLESLRFGNAEVVGEAFRYLGLPYRYGGHLPYDTDCSLLVQRVFLSKGIRLPRTAAEQVQVGISVSLSDVQPGDRFYFINGSGRINHTGIYIGGGQFIHASSNRGCVAVDNLSGSYLRRLVAIRR